MSKNPHAVELGRLGGVARAKKLTKIKRRQIARKASLARFLRKDSDLSAKKVLDKNSENALS